MATAFSERSHEFGRTRLRRVLFRKTFPDHALNKQKAPRKTGARDTSTRARCFWSSR
jgi:hypothetical protein